LAGVQCERFSEGDPMKSPLLLFAAALLLSLQVSHGGQEASGSVAKGGEAGEIRAAEAAMMAAGEEKGAAGYMSYYADDAVELPNGEAALQGKEAIAKTMDFLNDENNRLTWTPTHVDVAASGDLGYTYGNYEFRSIGEDGKPTSERGKYATVWKKQKDGSWKVVLDIGNASSRQQ
jgi:uncharacterized protein (TIGR02246 family)